MNYLRLLPLLCGLLSASACELVASFDQDKLDQNRTLGPTPLPTIDGAVAVVPDGSLRFDGALVRDDTGVASPTDAATDAARDAAPHADASDGQLPDADLADAGLDDAGTDARDAGDAGDVDGGPGAAGPDDSGLAPDLFADV